MEKKIQELESNKKDPGSANCADYVNNLCQLCLIRNISAEHD